MAGPSRVAPGLAVPGEGTVDYRWIDLYNVVVAEPEAAHYAGTKLFHNNVVCFSKAVYNRSGPLFFQVERQGFFSTVHMGVGGRHAAAHRPCKPHKIGV